MEKISKVLMTGADCALDLGDGSERALYVNQDYILRKLGKIHRGISLMYTYYPKDKGWPLRASVAFPQKEPNGAWNYRKLPENERKKIFALRVFVFCVNCF